jgi:aldehyde dehydrogenase
MNKVEFSRTAKVPFAKRYDNYIGGAWVAPKAGRYFENISPVTGRPLGEVARSDAADIEAALDAAHKAKDAWGKTAPATRALILNRIADRMEENLDLLALAETWDNGKPIRETTAADVPLAIDHFRYFAGALRGQEGSLSQIDDDTVAYHFHEPLGVVGQIIPWNFPLLMACWKLAPALAAGNCVVLKPAEQTPATIMLWADLIGDLLPEGVLNIVNGFGLEAGKPLASSPRIAKIAFTGETTTGRLIMQYASQNLIPVTLELGGKSPNIFFQDVTAEDDDFFDKAIEGFVMFALNQGEVCTCPSRALVHEKIYDRFMERALKRVEAIVQGDPLDPATMIGARLRRSSWRRSCPTWTSAARKAPSCWPAVNAPTCRATLPAAITSSRPCSGATTRCASSKRRFSGRLSRSPPSRTMMTRCRLPTIRSMASAPESGAATPTGSTASAAPFRPAASGPTATTPIRRTLPSAVTSSRASAARRTR